MNSTDGLLIAIVDEVADLDASCNHGDVLDSTVLIDRGMYAYRSIDRMHACYI